MVEAADFPERDHVTFGDALYLSLAKTGATLLPVATATSRELPR